MSFGTAWIGLLGVLTGAPAQAADFGGGWTKLYDPLQKPSMLAVWARGDRDERVDFEYRLVFPTGSGDDPYSDDALAIARAAYGSQNSSVFRLPVNSDRMGFDFLLDWAPSRPVGKTVVVPHFRVGTGLLLQQGYTLSAPRTSGGEPLGTREKRGLRLPITVEGTFELWSRYHAGLRFVTGMVGYAEPDLALHFSPNPPTQFTTRLRIGLDLMFSPQER